MMDSKDGYDYFAKEYNPIEVGSIDRTDTVPHDKAIIRALNAEYKPNPRIYGDPKKTIFVTRLNLRTTEEQLAKLFRKYGEIVKCTIIKDFVTKCSRGYAFIEFKHSADTEECYRKANKMEIDGKIICVDYEHERLKPGWKPRRLGGGFGGNTNSGQLRFGCRVRPFQKPL